MWHSVSLVKREVSVACGKRFPLPRRLSAAKDSDGNIGSVFKGSFYASAMLHRALDDDTRFHVERQLAHSAGRSL